MTLTAVRLTTTHLTKFEVNLKAFQNDLVRALIEQFEHEEVDRVTVRAKLFEQLEHLKNTAIMT